MPQRRRQPRGQFRLFQPDTRTEPHAKDRRDRRPGLGRGRRTVPGDLGGDRDLPGTVSGAPELGRGHPAEGGQVGPLVLVRLQRLQVQEYGRAIVPGRLEQRGGDQVPDPAGREQVLGREQPVVAGQAHPPAQRHRLAQQPGAEPAGHFGRDRGGEEHPRVRPDAGSGHLQPDGYLHGAAGLDVHQRVEHRLWAVEVSGQPPALITVQQRVKADMNLA